MRSLALITIVAASACSSSGGPVGTLRFHNASPVWRVDDTQPLAKAPEVRDYNRTLYHADGYVFKRVKRGMELRIDIRAKDVNALDEVPDSTWFENRIGIRDFTIEELTRAANVDDSPFDHRPWTITGAKVGGMSVGFQFEDAKGRKFLLKFDGKGFPELETGAHAIVHRILWAIGYNVPQDFIGNVDRADLVVGPKAKKKGFSDAKLDEALKLVNHSNGKIRVLASKYVDGKPVGPYAREGTRGDDPNDLIAHDERRSLRGQYPIFAWLQHTDLQEDNTLDSFDDGHITHYLIDFGKALGVMATVNSYRSPGYEFRFDAGKAFENLFTFGLAKKPFDTLRQPQLPGIGMYDAEHYDPGEWRPSSIYHPLLMHDRFDAFWGSKLLMRFKPHELRAIVKEAQFSDPKAEQYMLETLIRRQRTTARYWFDRVAPLDAFDLVGEDGNTQKLCFTDLMLSYKLRENATTYALDTFDDRGKSTGFQQQLPATSTGRVCTAVPLTGAKDGYTIIRLRVRRITGGKQFEMPEVVVHLARDAKGQARIIGLRRR